MIPLETQLDDMDFDALFELARSRLPALAKEWTDYNFHDPGITLIDLLAWVSDSQIYSLARNRRDERIAMAGLLGIRPRGAISARGELYPVEQPQSYRLIEADTRLAPIRAAAPRLEVAQTIDLLPVSIEAVISEGGPAGDVDRTATNAHPRASYAPFGTPGNPHASLLIQLRETAPLPDADLSLSLGFIMEGDDAPDADLGQIAAFYRDAGGQEHAIAPVLDTSFALQTNGVIVLPIPVRLRGGDRHRIVLRPVGKVALMPRLIRVAPNALPVVQRAKVEWRLAGWGNGGPGQTQTLELAQLLDADEVFEGAAWRLNDLNGSPSVKVELSGDASWVVGNPDEADPAAKVYAVEQDEDGRRIVVRFGNGINGSRPAANASLRLNLELSCGAGGNVSATLNWALRNYGLAWTNETPIRGGIDPLDATTMLDQARIQLRDARPLATSAQIESAALKLPAAFGVVRAQVEDGWERGRRRPASPRTRSLIVMRKQMDGAATETAAWTRAIHGRIAPRLNLGERLIVEAAQYRRFRVTARISVGRGLLPVTIAAAVRADLIDRLTPAGKQGAHWPMGRSVSAIMIGGWIRRIQGVVRVTELSLLDENQQPLADTIAVNRGELPWLIDAVINTEPAGERP